MKGPASPSPTPLSSLNSPLNALDAAGHNPHTAISASVEFSAGSTLMSPLRIFKLVSRKSATAARQGQCRNSSIINVLRGITQVVLVPNVLQSQMKWDNASGYKDKRLNVELKK